MLSYIVRRLGISLVTFFLATILIFAIIQLPPGDFVNYMISQSGGVGGISTAAEKLRHYYGLDQPLYVQYFKWVFGLLRGDLGYSFLYRKPVSEVVASEILWTVTVTGLSFVFSWSIGIVIGIYSAIRKYSLGDYLFTALGFFGLSIPPFFLGLILIYLLVGAGTGITGGLFSEQFLTSAWTWERVLDLLKHLWIPIVAIGTSNIAEIIRIMRGSLLEVINQPHVQTARAKGLKEFVVVIKHGVRLAINPLISLAGLLMPKLVSGIVVTGVVLNLPVIGPTFIEALQSQDMYLAGAYLMMTIVLLLIGNLLADLALAWSDPRIRLE